MPELMKCKCCGKIKPPAREYKGEALCYDCEETEAGFRIYSRWMDAAILELHDTTAPTTGDKDAGRQD